MTGPSNLSGFVQNIRASVFNMEIKDYVKVVRLITAIVP